MARCEHCGAPLESGDKKCPFCGSPVKSSSADQFASEGAFFSEGGTGASVSGTGYERTGSQYSNTNNTENAFSNLVNGLNGDSRNDEEAPLAMKIVSFVFPFIGLILILANRMRSPEMARSLTVWVIAGFVKGFLFSAIDGSIGSVLTLNQVRRVIDIIA